MGKPRKVNFEIIPEDVDGKTPEPYQILWEVRNAHHQNLEGAEVALAWRKALKPDPEGHLVLGRCQRTSDLQREFSPYDYIILLNQEVWNEEEFTRDKKLALVDHELCHAEISTDQEGEVRIDERGRKVWRTKKHDIEEFYAIVQRHGCYKRDLEIFAEELLKRKAEKEAAAR